MKDLKYITHENFAKFLNKLNKDYLVYVPEKKGEMIRYEKYSGDNENIVIGEIRAVEPVKSFFTRAREMVAEGFNSDVPHSEDKPFAVVGVKACDLKGFKVQDHVFADDGDKDPFYVKLREENLIISADCTSTKPTCFCGAIGITPYPSEDYDLNLSEMEHGFLIAVGSDKGGTVIEKNSILFQEAGDKFITRRDDNRHRVTSQVEENIKDNELPSQDAFKDMVERNFGSGIWEDEAKMCVECGACTVICPTCHCFFLYDQKNEKNMARLRVWDSCMIKDYARVGGGENPREKLWMRLRNRFEKKFDFFPKVLDIYACTGCGRCISACPAKIDIRKVIKRLVDSDGKQQ